MYSSTWVNVGLTQTKISLTLREFKNLAKDNGHNCNCLFFSHDDVGWLETVDEYYVDQVQFILDGVVQELEKDPTKRFIYVEMAFFWRWWNEQDQDTKDTVKRLVQNGQLEFTNGG